MSFADFFTQWFARPAEPLLREADVEQLAARHTFSQYLCYETYDETRKEYGNSGGTVGYMWECRPLAFLTDKSLECLAGLLRQDYPDKTTVQFLLVPDDALDAHLNAYLALKQRQDPIVQHGAAQYARHLHEGRRGLAGMGGTPVRNFRLLVAIKSSESFKDDRIKWIEEMLTQGGLAPRALEPAAFLDLMRRLLNSESPVNTAVHDPSVYLRKQIVQAETRIGVEEDHIRIGSRYAACLSPKSMPASGQLDCLAINALIGGYEWTAG